MAELGAAASVLGIASLMFQVGDSLIKLKAILDMVKEAPEDIKSLIEELEIHSLVLSGIEATHEADSLDCAATATTRRSLEYCRKGVNIVETIVKELDIEIGKRKRLGGFKVVLRMGTFNKMNERLRSAQFLLILSNQMYSE